VEAVAGWVRRGTAAWLLATRPDVEGLAALAKKHSTTSSDKPRRTAYFDLTNYLSGWKYLNLADRLRRKTVKGIRETLDAGGILSGAQRVALGIPNDGSRLSPQQVSRALAAYATAPAEDIVARLVPNQSRHLEVTLTLVRTSNGAAAGFSRPRSLYVFAGNTEPEWGSRVPARFRKYMRELGGSVEHELIHYTQDLLRVLTQTQEAGLPSARTPGYQQEQSRDYGYVGEETEADIAHALDDVEFYTRLKDEVRAFNRKIQRMELPDGPEAHTFWSRARKLTIADASSVRDSGPRLSARIDGIAYGPVEPSFFFKALRAAPAKWRKAVGEFMKATESSAPGRGKSRVRMPQAPTHSYRGTDARLREILSNPGPQIAAEARTFLARFSKAAASFDAEEHAQRVQQHEERNRKRIERGRKPRAPFYGLQPDAAGFDTVRRGWTGEDEEGGVIGSFAFTPAPLFTMLRKYAPNKVQQALQAFYKATDQGRPS
jgi:hypothetical protein